MNDYNTDLQSQIDEINKMIEFNKRKADEHIESPIEKRSMTEEQYIKLLKRTAMMRECLKEIEKLDKG